MNKCIENAVARMLLTGGPNGFRAKAMRAALIAGDRQVIEEILWDHAKAAWSCDADKEFARVMALADACLRCGN